MRLYHGTNTEIVSIDLTKGRRGKDFGKGFYANPNYMQAVRFSELVVKREGEGYPLVNVFEFDEKALSSLNVMIFDGYSKEWAEFILKNRANKFDENIHSYDIVIGPIADDNIGTQIRRLTRGYISMEMFLDEIKYNKPAIQYFFATDASIKFLKKV